VWVFAGSTVKLTTLAGQRLTGTASVPLAGNTAAAQPVKLDLCYQPAGGGPLQNFTGPDASILHVTTVRRLSTVAASAVPGPGDWNVGLCIMNTGATTLNNNHRLNGWVLVTP
jgi:hypothetical protein